MQLRNCLVVVVLGLAACADKDSPDGGSADTGGGDPGGSGGSGGDAGGDSGDGDAGDGGGSGTSTSDQPPTMSQADAWCYQHETGEARWIWQVVGRADDPQGLDTLELIVPEGVVVKLDGAECARLDLACDAAGACSGSFDELETGVLCSEATRSSFEITALDEDGNRSSPAIVSGRQQ